MRNQCILYVCLPVFSLVVQGLSTPHPSVRTSQNQANQPGILPKAAPGVLKKKEAQNESSTSSDSEDETDLTPSRLPAPSSKKAPALLMLREKKTFYFQWLY